MSGATDIYTNDGASLAVAVFKYYSNGTSAVTPAVTGTAEVGSKTGGANALGLYDMSGNVYEWCWDWYAYTNTTTSWYNGYTDVDPKNSEYNTTYPFRVIRGGGWSFWANFCQVAGRHINFPYDVSFDRGFRVVRKAL
jgi:formylglycine-generating enzyme